MLWHEGGRLIMLFRESDVRPKAWRDCLIRGLSKLLHDSIISISIVGSYRSATSLTRVQDIDIVIIVERLSVEVFIALTDDLRQLASSLSDGMIVVSLELRSGPIKPDFPHFDSYNVQLHVSIYDRLTWCKVVRYPGCREWVDHNLLIGGVNLSQICRPEPITVQSVLRDTVIMQANVLSQSAYSRVYELIGNNVVSSMESIPLNDFQFAQLLTSVFGYLEINIPKLSYAKSLENANVDEVLITRLERLKQRLRDADYSAVEETLILRWRILDSISRTQGSLEKLIRK